MSRYSNGRALLAASALLLSLTCPISAQESPLWRGIEKTNAMKEADRQFVEEVKQDTGGDLQTGARHAVQRGWEALGKKNYDIAIRRFNQASLLDPENPAIYWGFALATHVRGESLEVSETWFAEAEKREMAPAPRTALLTDHGRVLDEKGQPEKAKAYFVKALKIDPAHIEAHVGMARVLLQLGDSRQAKFHKEEVERLRRMGN